MSSDRDLDLLMDQWLAGGPTDPADRLKGEAMAKVVVTPQVRGTLRQGRYMNMTALTGVAAALILAVSGAGLWLAVSDSESAVAPAPAAVADLDPAEVVAKVAGDLVFRDETQATVEHTDIAYETRGLAGFGRSSADDPRLVGDVEFAYSSDDFRPGLGGPYTMASTLHIENDDGAWDGLVQGVGWPQADVEILHQHVLLTGSGGYEGQSAYLDIEEERPGGFPGVSFEGLIFPGGMPEVS